MPATLLQLAMAACLFLVPVPEEVACERPDETPIEDEVLEGYSIDN